MSNKIYGYEINEIKSIYGKEHLEEYLQKQKNNTFVIDRKKAEILSLSIGFQLPKPPINFSYENSIVPKTKSVNPKIKKSVIDKLHSNQEAIKSNTSNEIKQIQKQKHDMQR